MNTFYRTYAKPLAALLAGLSLAGAGAQGAQQPSGSQYVGSTYILTHWQERGREVRLGQQKPTLQLVGHRASGFSGCNSYSASYVQRLDSLRFGTIAGTLKACPQPIMAQESRYLAALSRVNTVRMQGPNMVLFSGRERLTFSPVPTSPVPTGEAMSKLPEGSWKLRSITNSSVTTFQPASRVQFTITPEGNISGNDGCNQFNGKVTLSGSRLRFAGPVISTRMLCQDTPLSLYDLLGRDESGAGATLSVEGMSLNLTRDDGQVWHFTRQSE